MANTSSARKRIRSNERKHLRNRSVRSAVRTSIAKARKSLLAVGDEADDAKSVVSAVKALDRAAAKGILHKNNANRRKARLMSMASKLALASAGGNEEAARAAAAGGEKGKTTKPATGTKATSKSGIKAKATAGKTTATKSTAAKAKSQAKASAAKAKTAV